MSWRDRLRQQRTAMTDLERAAAARLTDANDRRLAGKATREDWDLINRNRIKHGYDALPVEIADE